MRLPDGAHTSQPWRIHELTRDFRLEHVWAQPTPGGPDDFPRLVQLIASGRPFEGSPPVLPAPLRDPVEDATWSRSSPFTRPISSDTQVKLG
jgi:hypothetical protein